MFKLGYTIMAIYLLGISPINATLPDLLARPAFTFHHAVNNGILVAVNLISPVRIG